MAVVVTAAAALGFSGCGAPPAPRAADPAAPPPGPGVPGPSGHPGESTPTPSPTPTPDPTELEPGTNHNRAAAAYTYPAEKVQQWSQQGAKAPDYPSKKIAFLTFDDGPTTNMTPKDLDVLKDNGAHATFYYITRQLDAQTTPIAKRAIAEGNAIDVHSHSHNYNLLYPGRSCNADNVTKDYDSALKEMRSALGPDYTDHGFRYPGGHMSWKNMSPCDQALADKGVHWVDWNSMTGDAEPPKTRPSSPEGMVQMVAKDAEGSHDNVVVVLMHDASDKSMTNKALPGVIDWFKKNGYEFGVID